MNYVKERSFSPDYHHLVRAARNERTSRLPLYEHCIGEKVIYELTGTRPYALWFSSDMAESREGFRQYWDFWRTMGYDTASMEFNVCRILVGGGALGAHREGCIKTREDFELYPWHELPGRFFARYAPYIRNFADTCPPGMNAVGGVGNGIFEAVQDIVGYTNLCYLRADDPDVYAGLFAAMGDAQFAIWDRFMAEFADVFCVLRFGDDLGYKTQTLLPTDDVRSHIIPQYKRVIDRVHQEGKPFLLHSCGAIFNVMEELIQVAGIDAKHSNEDNIAHFIEWVIRYGDRIGNFGGVDTDVLCRETPQAIRAHVLDSLDRLRSYDGIAFSSGNSIPDYVPTERYCAMVEAVREWRGE